MTKLAGYKMSEGDSQNNSEEHNVKIVADQLLSRRNFMGIYLERRYVQVLNEYRDIIEINCTGNEELIKDLNYSMKRLREFYHNKKWIGITGPNCVGAPASYALWVKPQDIPLGEHEFMIKKVRFFDNEICVSVKSMKLVDSNINANNVVANNDENNNDLLNFLLNLDYQEISRVLYRTFNNAHQLLTVENSRMAFSLILAATSTLFVLLTEGIKWTGNFSIRFTLALTELIRACTPILLAILEIIQKLFGAMFLIIVMMWRTLTTGDSRVPPMEMRMLNNGNNRQYKGPPPQYARFQQGQYNRQNNRRW